MLATVVLKNRSDIKEIELAKFVIDGNHLLSKFSVVQFVIKWPGFEHVFDLEPQKNERPLIDSKV